MELLTTLNWEQLGASGIMIALLAWLFHGERTERKKAQEDRLNDLKQYSEKLEGFASSNEKAAEAFRQALEYLKP